MDIFEGPYYRMNKLLLTCLGEWPYQKRLHKYIIRIALLTFTVSVIYAEVLFMISVRGNLDATIECGSAFGVQISNSIKFSNYIFNEDKMKILLTRIKNDWTNNMFGAQLPILKKYADEGRIMTQLYGVYMYSTVAGYVLFPLVPKLIAIVLGRNGTWPEIPFPIKYGDLDPQKYYFPMMIHSDCWAIIIITTVVAMDSTYVVYVQHACGIFAAIGDRLERLMERFHQEPDESSTERLEEETYREIVACVKMHAEAIEFSEAIESTYVVVFFFVIGLSVFCMSVAGYQTVTNLDKPNEAVRFATFVFAQVAHIFFISWPGQKLIDHSEHIHEWSYVAPWYLTSARSRKLLILMMHRSIKPCSITAGKLYVMSLPSFSMVIRTSVSYFTVLTSFR